MRNRIFIVAALLTVVFMLNNSYAEDSGKESMKAYKKALNKAAQTTVNTNANVPTGQGQAQINSKAVNNPNMNPADVNYLQNKAEGLNQGFNPTTKNEQASSSGTDDASAGQRRKVIDIDDMPNPMENQVEANSANAFGWQEGTNNPADPVNPASGQINTNAGNAFGWQEGTKDPVNPVNPAGGQVSSGASALGVETGTIGNGGVEPINPNVGNVGNVQANKAMKNVGAKIK